MNRNANGGILYEYGNEYIVRGAVATTDVDAIAKAVVKRVDGVPVLMGDVAEVKIGDKAPKLGTASVRANPAVLLTVTKQPNTSTLDLTENCFLRWTSYRKICRPMSRFRPIYSVSLILSKVP